MKKSETPRLRLTGLTITAMVLVAMAPTLISLARGDGSWITRASEQPLVVALVAFLVQRMMNESDRQLEQAAKDRDELRAALAQSIDHAFAFGSSSHMANVAFDKHVEFCEAYAAELRETHDTLIREGPTPQGIDHAAKLVVIRSRFALWLSPAVVARLKDLEQALRTMGADEHRLRTDPALSGLEHQQKVDSAFDRFFEVLGENLEEHHRRDIGLDAIVQALSKVLGVEDLTRLRESVLRKSLASLN